MGARNYTRQSLVEFGAAERVVFPFHCHIRWWRRLLSLARPELLLLRHCLLLVPVEARLELADPVAVLNDGLVIAHGDLVEGHPGTQLGSHLDLAQWACQRGFKAAKVLILNGCWVACVSAVVVFNEAFFSSWAPIVELRRCWSALGGRICDN